MFSPLREVRFEAKNPDGAERRAQKRLGHASDLLEPWAYLKVRDYTLEGYLLSFLPSLARFVFLFHQRSFFPFRAPL